MYEIGIELNIRDIKLLYKLKKILGVGVIKTRKRVTPKGLTIELGILTIRNKKHLKEIILPIFDRYPMLSLKQYDYLRFKENLLNNIIYFEDLKPYIRPNIPLYTVETILSKSYFSS
ncbi:hypothetical protein HGI15_22075 [Modestobacter lapidis]|nr:hypothetical protein [Modestobacter lapidis]